MKLMHKSAILHTYTVMSEHHHQLKHVHHVHSRVRYLTQSIQASQHDMSPDLEVVILKSFETCCDGHFISFNVERELTTHVSTN